MKQTYFLKGKKSFLKSIPNYDMYIYASNEIELSIYIAMYFYVQFDKRDRTDRLMGTQTVAINESTKKDMKTKISRARF